MSPTLDAHRQYFEQAYNTGTDVWSHIPIHREILKLFHSIPQNALVLDVGAGRGLLDFKLVDAGYRVIGLDYIEKMVQSNNEEVKKRGVQEKIRFVQGNVLDIPFVDNSFDCLLDSQLLQHLKEEDWSRYIRETQRVLKQGGTYILIALSRKTSMLLDFIPSQSETGSFEKYGLQYNFFTEEQLQDLLGLGFSIEQQEIEVYDSRSDPGEQLAFIITKAIKN